MYQHTQSNQIAVKKPQFCVFLILNENTQTEVGWLFPRTLCSRKEHTPLFSSEVFMHREVTFYSSRYNHTYLILNHTETGHQGDVKFDSETSHTHEQQTPRSLKQKATSTFAFKSHLKLTFSMYYDLLFMEEVPEPGNSYPVTCRACSHKTIHKH